MGAENRGRLTAIVINHNSGELLAECVGSLLEQADVGGVVVVDNASSDQSLEALEPILPSDASVEILRNKENLGYAAAVNRGLGRVATDLALLVNPDCIVGGRIVGDLVEEAERVPSSAVVGGIVLGMDGVLQRATRRRYPTPGLALRRAIGLTPTRRPGAEAPDFDRSSEPLPPESEDVDAVSGALMLVRMAAVAQVGGMDEDYFLHCEDLDWCIRFRRAGWSVRFVPSGFAVHVQGVSSRGRPVAVQWHLHRGMLRFYGKFEAERHNRLFNTCVRGAVAGRFVARSISGLSSSLGRRPGPEPPELGRLRVLRNRANTFRAPRTLVIGATSPVAGYLLGEPVGRDEWTLAVSRTAPPVRLGDRVLWMRSADGGNLPSWAREGLRRVIHLAPLWTLSDYLEHLSDVPLRRVVACSSTSVLTKAASADPAERELASALAAAEENVRAHCRSRGIELVLLRPTLIYAPGRDRSLERIARVAKRAGIFPIAGRGAGLRQPVHAADVAAAARAALDRPQAAGRCYTVSGGEALSYREMIERIFLSAGVRPRIVSVPAAAYRLALKALRWWPGWKVVPPRAADRMDEDMAFDHEAATRDLDFHPRLFLERQ